jgi:hypothetical protein
MFTERNRAIVLFERICEALERDRHRMSIGVIGQRITDLRELESLTGTCPEIQLAIHHLEKMRCVPRSDNWAEEAQSAIDAAAKVRAMHHARSRE